MKKGVCFISILAIFMFLCSPAFVRANEQAPISLTSEQAIALTEFANLLQIDYGLSIGGSDSISVDDLLNGIHAGGGHRFGDDPLDGFVSSFKSLISPEQSNAIYNNLFNDGQSSFIVPLDFNSAYYAVGGRWLNYRHLFKPVLQMAFNSEVPQSVRGDLLKLAIYDDINLAGFLPYDDTWFLFGYDDTAYYSDLPSGYAPSYEKALYKSIADYIDDNSIISFGGFPYMADNSLINSSDKRVQFFDKYGYFNYYYNSDINRVSVQDDRLMLLVPTTYDFNSSRVISFYPGDPISGRLNTIYYKNEGEPLPFTKVYFQSTAAQDSYGYINMWYYNDDGDIFFQTDSISWNPDIYIYNPIDNIPNEFIDDPLLYIIPQLTKNFRNIDVYFGDSWDNSIKATPDLTEIVNMSPNSDNNLPGDSDIPSVPIYIPQGRQIDLLQLYLYLLSLDLSNGLKIDITMLPPECFPGSDVLDPLDINNPIDIINNIDPVDNEPFDPGAQLPSSLPSADDFDFDGDGSGGGLLWSKGLTLFNPDIIEHSNKIIQLNKSAVLVRGIEEGDGAAISFELAESQSSIKSPAIVAYEIMFSAKTFLGPLWVYLWYIIGFLVIVSLIIKLLHS